MNRNPRRGELGAEASLEAQRETGSIAGQSARSRAIVNNIVSMPPKRLPL
jgi:hypothetical protein